MGDVSDSVRTVLDGVSPAKRRRDAETMLELMARATGQSPQVYYGTGFGYGQYHYKCKSGREGDAPAAGFAPRKAATVVYLVDGIGRYEEQLKQLGPHTTGVGRLYIKDLEKIDLFVPARPRRGTGTVRSLSRAARSATHQRLEGTEYIDQQHDSGDTHQ